MDRFAALKEGARQGAFEGCFMAVLKSICLPRGNGQFSVHPYYHFFRFYILLCVFEFFESPNIANEKATTKAHINKIHIAFFKFLSRSAQSTPRPARADYIPYHVINNTYLHPHSS